MPDQSTNRLRFVIPTQQDLEQRQRTLDEQSRQPSVALPTPPNPARPSRTAPERGSAGTLNSEHDGLATRVVVPARPDSPTTAPLVSRHVLGFQPAPAAALPQSVPSRPSMDERDTHRPVVIRKQPKTHAVVVNSCQYGNPVLDFIRNVPWEYGDIVPDYTVGQTSCVLFLSLKYHRLHPEYAGIRIDMLRDQYQLRVLLVLVDIDDSRQTIRELTQLSVQRNLTVMLAWSSEEAGRYIETFKALENHPPDLIREKVEDAYFPRLTSCLTSVRAVNKTDVMTLASNFKSFKKIVQAPVSELTLCPGFGEHKVSTMLQGNLSHLWFGWQV
ncbi:ssDNA endonuclease and repair protein rad10 [Dimargaris verticillata]|uniref:SsDNA endonuclease and repair protein rad10 n=1 Tax=Dimargaris verticillata TaxID=2761393 RepID=A0A9W8B5Q3_9FUNG|nr:ssDNA endonuclease and repair protein rad10 [Dimargaris verticillata]